jgi:carboxyl-terminal processing protease
MKRLLILAGCFFFGGVIAARVAGALPQDSTYAKLGIFARVLAYVENNYVETVDRDKLMYGAVNGLVSTLDPHTSFMTPQQYRDLKDDTDGHYGGIGLEVEVRGSQLVVVTPIDGTPAAKAGIHAGDHILKIDDASTDGMDRDEAAHRMRGAKGSRVRLLVMREGWSDPREFGIARDLIRIVAVDGRPLSDGVAYVRMKTFQDHADKALDDELDRLESDSRGGLKGLVLDLRNNPGGLLDQAVRVADLFLDKGLIVRTRGKGGRLLEEEHAHPRGTRKPVPMVVLVNGGTASAAEIVAGALQDHRRAVILGTQTFGKGSVQTIIELDDGSALKLTVARYYTPLGRSIQESGIHPDIVVEPRDPARSAAADMQREKDLDRHLKPEPSAGGRHDDLAGIPPDDLQLQTAYEYLRSLDVLRASSTTGG